MMNILDKKIESLVKKEGLDQFDIYFRDYSDFEEIPLFSRWDNISFLRDLSFNEKNKVLIKKGVELVNNAISNSSNYIDSNEIDEYFICITIMDWDDYKEINCLTPNIFISGRKSWVLSHLKLSNQSSIEEYLISEYLFSLGLADYGVFVPSYDNDENKRVYIIHKRYLDSLT